MTANPTHAPMPTQAASPAIAAITPPVELKPSPPPPKSATAPADFIPSPVPRPTAPPPKDKWTLPAVPLPGYVRDWNTSTGLQSSSIIATTPPPSQQAEDVSARELQQKMKDFGLFTGTVNGQLDKPTLKAMQTVASIIGDGTMQPTHDIGKVRIYVDAMLEQSHAMLYAVDRFPFAGQAPNWLLSVLDDQVLEGIARQVESALSSGATGAVSIDGGRSGVTIVAMLRGDRSSRTTLLECRAYHLTFAKGPLHFAVTTSACRNPIGNDWRVARN